MSTDLIQRSSRVWIRALLLGLVAFATPRGGSAAAGTESPPARTLLRKDDRVAFVGSSSTHFGVWPRTVEFLIRTRHPGLVAEFSRFSTGGGTFKTGLEQLDGWLDQARPTVVILNYGANDASDGLDGLARFKERMAACVAKVETHGARVILVTPQAADARKAGLFAASNRRLYAETMLGFGREQGWPVIDVHHPLEAMQRSNQRANPTYTILRDSIHLTGPAYIGWGFLFYDRLELPLARSAAVLKAGGSVVATENCTIRDVVATPDTLAFTRTDAVLPILPPVPLPPRYAVPLEALSPYRLRIEGLPPGLYEIHCEEQLIGTTRSLLLQAGVNLNTLLLDEHREPPWHALAHKLWEGHDLQRIGTTPWRFEVRRVHATPDVKPGGP